MSKMIYENSLFYSLENNIISGYGLLINYIHAVNFKLIFDFTSKFTCAQHACLDRSRFTSGAVDNNDVKFVNPSLICHCKW